MCLQNPMAHVVFLSDVFCLLGQCFENSADFPNSTESPIDCSTDSNQSEEIISNNSVATRSK